jgi:hypothetical protein
MVLEVTIVVAAVGDIRTHGSDYGVTEHLPGFPEFPLEGKEQDRITLLSKQNHSKRWSVLSRP